MASDDTTFEDFRDMAADMLERSDQILTNEHLLKLDFDAFAAKLSNAETRGLSLHARKRAVAQAVLENHFGDFHRDAAHFFEDVPVASEKGVNLRSSYQNAAAATWDPKLAGEPLSVQATRITSGLDESWWKPNDELQFYEEAFADLARREERAGRADANFEANIEHAQRSLFYSNGQVPSFEKKRIAEGVSLGLLTDKEREAQDLPPAEHAPDSLRGRLARWAKQNVSRSRTARLYLSVRAIAQKIERRSFSARQAKFASQRPPEQTHDIGSQLHAPDMQLVGPEDLGPERATQERDAVTQEFERAPTRDNETERAELAPATQARDVSDTLEMPLADTGELSPSSYEDAWESKLAHHLRAHGGDYNLSRPVGTQALNALITDVLDEQARELYEQLEDDLESMNRDGLGEIDIADAYHDAGLPTRMEMVRAAARAAEHHVLTHDAELLQYEYRDRAHGHAQAHADRAPTMKSLADCIEFEAITEAQAETYVLFSDAYEEINRVAQKEVDKGRDVFSVARDRNRQLQAKYLPEETLTPDDRRLAAEHVSEGVQRELELDEIHALSDQDFKNRLFSDYEQQLGHVAEVHDFEKSVGDLSPILEDAERHTALDAPEGWPSPEAAQSFERFRTNLENDRATQQRSATRSDEVTRAAIPRSQANQQGAEVTRNARPPSPPAAEKEPNEHLRVTREAPKAMTFQGFEPPEGKHYQALEHLNRYSGEFSHFAEIDGERVAVIENDRTYTTVATERDTLEPGTPVRIRKSKDARGNWISQISELGKNVDKGLER